MLKFVRTKFFSLAIGIQADYIQTKKKKLSVQFFIQKERKYLTPGKSSVCRVVIFKRQLSKSPKV